MRLTEKGRRWKVVGDHRYQKFSEMKQRFEVADQLLSSAVQPNIKWKRLLSNLSCGEGALHVGTVDLIGSDNKFGH